LQVDKFTDQIEAMRVRVTLLDQEANQLPLVPQKLLEGTFKELHTALEELHVAQEQRLQQNEELVATRQAVEAQSQRYQELFDFAPDAYLVTDADGTIQEANCAAAILFNISQPFLVGKPLVSFVPLGERHTFHSQLKQLGKKIGQVQEWDVQLYPCDGKPFDATLRVAAFQDRQHKSISLRCLVRDITLAKQAEKVLQAAKAELEIRGEERTTALRETNHQLHREVIERQRLEAIATARANRYEAAIHLSGKIFYEWNPHTETSLYSGNSEKILGYSLEEITGDRTNWSELIHPDDQQAFNQQVKQITTNKEPFHLEYRMRRKDGSYIVVQDDGYFLFDEAGEVMSLLGFVGDISDRKQLEAELCRREQELTDFVNNGAIGLHWVGADGYILWANPAELELLGYTQDEYIGHHISEFHADQEVIDDILKRLTANETLHNYEARLLCKDGSIKYVLIDSNVFWKDEQFIHTRCFTRDITARKQAETALRSSQEQLQAILDNSPAVIYVIDAHNRHLLVNRQYQTLFCGTTEPCLGKSLYDIWPREIADGFAANNQRVLESGIPIEVEEVASHDDGMHTYISIKFPLYDASGFPYAVCGISTDITVRKQAEQTLRENEERFRSLSACSPAGIFLTDVEGHCTYANPRCQAICGFTLEESLGEGWSHSVYPDDRQRVFADWSQTTREGRFYSDEFRFQTKEGKVRWVHVRSAPMFCDQGQLIGHVGTVEDITERKQALDRLTESENRWRTIIEAEPECVKLVASDGTLLDMNAAGLAMIEAESANAAIGQSVYSLITPEHQEAFVALNESVCQGSRGRLEFEIIGLNGTRRWMETHAVPLRSESDGTLVQLAISRDITARKQADAALEQAKQELEIRVEERTAQLRTANEQLLMEIAERQRVQEELERSLSILRGTLEATADGIIVSQNARHIATFNQKFVEMWSIPESVIASRDLNLLLPSILEQLKDPEAFMSETQELFSQPDAEAYGIFEFKDGRIFERYSLPQQISGNIVGRVCSFRDITERKRAELQIQQSEQKYRNLFHNSLVGIFRNALADGTVLDANAAALKMFGLDSYKGVKAVDLYVNPAERETLKQLLIERGVVENFETQLRRKDGSVIWVSYSTKLYAKEGYLEGVIIDITERKQAEEALKKTHDQLEIRVEERTVQLRQAIAKFRELAQREALLNRLASQIRDSLALDTILETAVVEIYNRLEIDTCLFAWYCPDDTSPGWDVVKEAKNPDLPSFLGLYPLEVWRPFTCRLINQEVFQVDNVTESDCEVQQMLIPFGTEALLSLPIETQSGKLGAFTCGRLVSKRSWTDDELELLQAVANQLVIAINQAQLYEQSRIAATTAQTKATELEVAMGKLQQTQAQLIQSEKMSSLGQLVAGVAHEINNPVNFIYGNLTHVNQYSQDLLNLVQLYQEYHPHSAPEIQAETEAIDLDFIKEDLPKILSSMKIGADRIRQIVLSLRNFSRLDQADRKWVDIHEGLDNTLLILAHRLKHKSDHPGIELIKEYGDLPLVQCYPGQLNQVFMNILTNAIDAIEEDKKERSFDEIKNHPSTIQIRTKVNDSNQVIIQIADNGLGMTQEVQRRVFDPFFTTKPVGSGTGLGMSISYKIVVEKHGGQLQCISAPGQGTKFLIYIPIQQPKSVGVR